MKLASLRSNDPRNRHGDLAVVAANNRLAIRSSLPNARTLLDALQNWREVEPSLRDLSRQLNDRGTSLPGSVALDLGECLAPLPLSPGFYDGSAFLSHVVRARRARGDEMPASARVTPLMYQGVSDNLLAWNAPIELIEVAHGGDFEGEFAVITTDVPKGAKADQVGKHIALVMLLNDITLREIVKTEIETKFGFLQSKPNSSFAPLVVTPDELGDAWKDGRVHLNLEVKLNGKLFGTPTGTEMNFSFSDLIAHACRTRPLSAGSIVGSGTVSNEDKGNGFACLTEKRFQEILDSGKPSTPWLKVGDHVVMDVKQNGVSVFGPIDETVKLI